MSGQNPSTIADFLSLSLSTIVPLNVNSSAVVLSTAAVMILTFEEFCGIVIAGLFVSLLLRWVVTR